ncbi:MAG: Gfo/Idh/MocA family oxidoreductase [Bacteroidota bacterium]
MPRLVFAVFILLSACTGSPSIVDDNMPKESTEPERVYVYDGEPLRIGIAGLTHTHVHWLLGRKDYGDVVIAGIAEPNRELAERYCEQHGLSKDLIYPSLEEMVTATEPEAVTAFNSTYEHLETVAFCAPRGIDVMVEKPLAVNIEHARKMAALAREHGIALLTNYETSWYGSNATAHQIILKEKKIGPIRRMVFRTGHPGPIEIGCNQEFLAWLTDPVMNGGGVVMDFGCYGANLATWLLEGQRPIAISCQLQTLKPAKYPKVDDEANILITYPDGQVTIQASWNWSHNLKEMDIYGTVGYVRCKDRASMSIMTYVDEKPAIEPHIAPQPINAHVDPFAYFAAVTKQGYEDQAFSPSSLENNLLVMEILEAAKLSAATGQTVKL